MSPPPPTCLPSSHPGSQLPRLHPDSTMAISWFVGQRVSPHSLFNGWEAANTHVGHWGHWYITLTWPEVGCLAEYKYQICSHIYFTTSPPARCSLPNRHPSSLLWHSECSRWKNHSLSRVCCCRSRTGSPAGTGKGRKEEKGGAYSACIDMQQTSVVEQRPLSTYWESRPADRVVD